ncbi:hypothetical protein AAU61_14525 [Desulfocarbo indianensis]|nr:hypothetical protein AAU61_14525 [Desulfocarbo indianensis]
MKGKLWLPGMALILGIAAMAWATESMSVQVKEGRVYAKPNFLSQMKGTLSYGQKVMAGEEEGAWRQVSASRGLKGWMHVSALTERQISLQAGAERAQTGASSEEMALAGKGFSKEVEASYRAQNRGLNYAAVDKMERAYGVSAAQVNAFLASGGLHGPEGEGQ